MGFLTKKKQKQKMAAQDDSLLGARLLSMYILVYIRTILRVEKKYFYGIVSTYFY